MVLTKLFIIQNYLDKYRKLRKSILIQSLLRHKNKSSAFFPIWKINYNEIPISDKTALDFRNFYVLGRSIEFSEVNWHKDSFSGYCYPVERIDKINFVKLFNKGIDLVFPWQQSRFNFAPSIAIAYRQSHNINLYNLIKKTIIHWINENPYLYGVNWISTMDVSIRAINWIVALNLVFDKLNEDIEFKRVVSESLVQHARFISFFPEVYNRNHTTNHTVAGYAGLLFLALSLPGNKSSGKWLKQAIGGLLLCLQYQVREDGADFEGSIQYHRLVLELFAYSGIISLANGLQLPDKYFDKVLKMFEFSEAYIDKCGHAPQIGDNDSGRILTINEMDNLNFYKNEFNHSYLISLKNIIFNSHQASQAEFTQDFRTYIPDIKSIQRIQHTSSISVTNKSFEQSGAYFIKNEMFDLMVACFPIGQNGRGGHNHLDQGSYCLSIYGKQIIVDPGSPVYSSDKTLRDRFRTYSYHNTLHTEIDENIDWNENGYWSLKQYYYAKVNSYTDNSINVELSFINDNNKRFRKFCLHDSSLLLEENYNGYFFSRINFHPDVSISRFDNNTILTNHCKILLDNCINYISGEYDYSPHYGKMVKAPFLKIRANNHLSINLIPLK